MWKILSAIDGRMRFTGFSLAYPNSKLYKYYSYFQMTILWILFVPSVAYIVLNLSDLTKTIDGLLFLSCDTMGLFKFIGIYRKRFGADKLIKGIQDVSRTGPIDKFLKADKKSVFLLNTFIVLIICSLIPFNLSAIVLSYMQHRRSNTTFYEEEWRFPFTIA